MSAGKVDEHRLSSLWLELEEHISCDSCHARVGARQSAGRLCAVALVVGD